MTDNIVTATRIEEERRLCNALLKHTEARLFMGMLLEEAGFLKPSFVEGDALETARREGERRIGQRIFEFIWRVSESKPLSCMREYGSFDRKVREKEKLYAEAEQH